MKVLIIPGDFRKDQYILKPIVSAMLVQIGRPRANIQICRDPLLQGIDQALRWERIEEIIEQYGMVDLFLLCVDRDGDAHRCNQLRNLEQKASQILGVRKILFAEHAWQELEVWVLAGLKLPSDWNWQQVRTEANPKETYFLKLADQRQLLDAPGNGRKALGEEAAKQYSRIKQLCPEDVANLENRIQGWMQMS